MKKYLGRIFAIIICLLVVTGCGKSKVEKNFTEIYNNLEKESEESFNETENESTETTSQSTGVTSTKTDDIKLYSDNSKIVFKTGQGMMVYYYSGEKITKYEAYLDYNDESTAKFALSLLDDEEEGIKKKYTKGKYLVIEYDESEYDTLTLSEVKTMYSYLEEIKKNN